ncbi:hypothetical protein VNO77_46324 [Canavalia gladiata]|uniref:Uncharacterized protein n=1 Tax=Canavalia gladiata TaxID=3824 RepID=A0AAN9PH20_CANGL
MPYGEELLSVSVQGILSSSKGKTEKQVLSAFPLLLVYRYRICALQASIKIRHVGSRVKKSTLVRVASTNTEYPVLQPILRIVTLG